MTNAISTSSLPLVTISNNIEINGNLSNESPLISCELINQEAQTSQITTVVKIKLQNVQTYVQSNANSDLYALVALSALELNGKTSKFKTKSEQQEHTVEALSNKQSILIKFKKKQDEPESKEGLLDILLEDFQFEIDEPTLNGLVDFVEDDPEFFDPKKTSIPANICIFNCLFSLSNNLVNENLSKKDITISSLFVKKSSTNEILIATNKSNKNYENIPSLTSKKFSLNKKKRTSSFSNRNLSAYESLKCFEKDLMDKVNSQKSEQLASLVYLLRKSREENFKLQSKLDAEANKCNQVLKEKQEILDQLNEKIKATKLNQDSINSSNISSNNNSCLSDQLELERKQFEDILKTIENENELMKQKLKKSDETIALMNIERDCLIKKLNEHLKTNKK
jgi:hypothetical protein